MSQFGEVPSKEDTEFLRRLGEYTALVRAHTEEGASWDDVDRARAKLLTLFRRVPETRARPDAYLKEWTETAKLGPGASMMEKRTRVDLTPQCETWMVGVKVTPLYRRSEVEAK